MKKAPTSLPLGEFPVALSKEQYPALPRFTVRLGARTTLWQRLKIAVILVVNPMGLNHMLTYEEVLVLSNMVEVHGLVRAVRMVKRRHRGS